MSIYNKILLKKQRRFQIQETSFEIIKKKRKTLDIFFCTKKRSHQPVPVHFWEMSKNVVNQVTACGCQSLAPGSKKLQEILDFIFNPLEALFSQIKRLHVDLKADRI